MTHAKRRPLRHEREALHADRIGGLIWFVFGVAVVYGSWTMDRLESLNIPPSTAPGVVPGLLGIGFIIFALILVFRREQRADRDTYAPRRGDAAPAEADDGRLPLEAHPAELVALPDLRRRCCSAAACHYWALTVGFLFLHIMLLDETEHVPARADAAPPDHRGDRGADVRDHRDA